MKIFLSYGDAGDQVLALRLQALGAVNGLSIYVPPVFTRRDTLAVLDPDSEERIRTSDVVVGVIGTGLSEACTGELNFAITLGLGMIVMAEPQWEADLRPVLDGRLVIIDPSNPGPAENGIVEHLNSLEVDESAKKALLALGTVALGLLMFAPQD